MLALKMRMLRNQFFDQLNGFQSGLTHWLDFIEPAIIQGIKDFSRVRHNLLLDYSCDGIDRINCYFPCAPFALQVLRLHG
jgi:hypothetical protein